MRAPPSAVHDSWPTRNTCVGRRTRKRIATDKQKAHVARSGISSVISIMPIKKGSESCKEKADIGLIGLAVMGENLILNMANHGFTVCCYNRTTSKVRPPISLCLRAVCMALTWIARWTTFWRVAPRAKPSSAATRSKRWLLLWRSLLAFGLW